MTAIEELKENPMVRRIVTSETVKQATLIGIGTILGSFFSYLLQFFLGRTLSVSDYGTFSALLSLSYLINVPATVLGISIIKRVATYTAARDNQTTTHVFKGLSLGSIIIGLFVTVIILLFSDYIEHRMNIDNGLLIASFAVAMGFSFISVIGPSFLQGVLKYDKWALYSVIFSFLRAVLGALPVIIGLGLTYVFHGFSLSILISYAFAYLLLKNIFVKVETKKMWPEYQKILFFGFSTFMISMALNIINNIDMVLVKRYFDSVTAGYYAGAITVGKILLFASTPISTLMFPAISAIYARKENYLHKLKQLVFLQIIISIVGLLIFELFPYKITTIFFGESFINSVPYLKYLAVFITIYIWINFLVLFFLSIEKTRIYLLLLPGIVIQYMLIYLFHNDAFDVINANIIGAGFSALILLIYLYITIKKVQYTCYNK